MITAATGIGMMFSLTLLKRAAQLEQAVRMVTEIENTIRFQATDTQGILANLNRQGDYPGLSFISAFEANVPSGASPQEVMARAVSLSRSETQLNTRDRELLQAFFLKLGTTDIEGQIKHCQYYKLSLEQQYGEAKTAAAQKSRLYVFLGFFAGLTFALFVI